MIELKAEIRNKFGRKTSSLRKGGLIPAVLYGPEIKNLSLKVPEKEFEKVFREAGESSLIKLKVYPVKSSLKRGARPAGEQFNRVKNKKLKTKESKTDQKLKADEFEVLIHQTARDPLTEKILHIDFYHPSTKEEVTAEIPLVFEGEAPAVKNLSGTLVREIQQVEVKGLAKNLPREIKVNVNGLKTFEDRVKVENLKVPEGVTILKDKEEIVASVASPREEEMPGEEEKPVEEEKAEEEKKAEEKGKEKGEEEKKTEK